jgi:hypothetical protein
MNEPVMNSPFEIAYFVSSVITSRGAFHDGLHDVCAITSDQVASSGSVDRPEMRDAPPGSRERWAPWRNNVPDTPPSDLFLTFLAFPSYKSSLIR